MISCRFEDTVDTAQIRKRYNMESFEKKNRCGKYCVAGISSTESCKNNSHTEGISMHLFPKEEEVRWKWIKFIQRRQGDFVGEVVNSAHNSLCSAHFEESCFTRKPAVQLEGMKLKKTLIQGSVPTIDPLPPNPDRQKGQISSDSNDEYALTWLRQSQRNWSDFCKGKRESRPSKNLFPYKLTSFDFGRI